jgi:methionyl-tRNA formyltransferase
LNKDLKPVCVLLTSRPWNEWLATDSEICEIADLRLITKAEDFTYEKIDAISPKYIFVPHWSSIIPKSIFHKFQTIIFHMTDLPFGRGGSPLQNLIQRGFSKTKISAIECAEKFDTGRVYIKEELDLSGTAEEIFVRASKVIKHMIVKILQQNILPQEQVGIPVVFKRRKPEESEIRSQQLTDMSKFYDFIRMLDAPGYPNAFIDIGDFRINFSRVEAHSNTLSGKFEIQLRKVQ